MSDSSLFSQYRWQDLELTNRMVLAPMTRGRANVNRIPNSIMGDYYVQRSSGGMIITEATSVSEEGEGWVDSPSVYTDEQVDGWKSVVKRVHQAGGRIVLQLWHTGRASHSDFHSGEKPFSASAVQLAGDKVHTPNGKKDYEVPRAMNTADIERTIGDYKRAARNAKNAGFDGVEIHAANGYLINQFLDGRCNQRTDKYGGSFENRYRLLDRISDAVLDIWSANRVGVRLSPNGSFNDMGCDDFRELHLFVAQRLNQKNIGYLHVMDGLGFGFHERGEPMTLNEFRDVYDGLIIGNVGYDKKEAEQKIESRYADLIAFGRPWITNPDLPERLENNYPLNNFDDDTYWYGGGEKGYTNYPTYKEETGKASLEKLTPEKV